MSYHTDRAREVVAAVIEHHGSNEDSPELRAKLHKAYPFPLGSKRGHQAWSQAIAALVARKDAPDTPNLF